MNGGEPAPRVPRISIVTPSYNQGQFIEATVRSVLLQGYPELEYILLDGGSSDETLAVLEPYQAHFARFASQPDGGQSEALHEGFSCCTGDILAYLNSDDLLAPGALDFVAGYFERNPEVDAIYSHRVVIDPANRVTGYWCLPRHSSELMRRWDLIPQETCFWRRRLLDTAGNVDPSYRFAMDYDLFVRYMKAGRFRRVDRALAAFRVHSGSKTSAVLESVGQGEMARVWHSQGLRRSPAYNILGNLYSMFVQLRSARYAVRRGYMPGAAAGTGYDFDDVWAGMLCDRRMPVAHREPAYPALAMRFSPQWFRDGSVPETGHWSRSAVGEASIECDLSDSCQAELTGTIHDLPHDARLQISLGATEVACITRPEGAEFLRLELAPLELAKGKNIIGFRVLLEDSAQHRQALVRFRGDNLRLRPHARAELDS